VSLFSKIGHVMRSELPIGHLDQDIATILLLGIMFLASSKQQWARTFFNNTWVVIAFCILVILFVVRLNDPPQTYWIFGFISAIIISFYLPRWYNRKKSE